MPDFIAFLVVKGEIHLRDEMPDGTDEITVRPGDLHIIAPGFFQTSVIPFAPGIRFLWFHFNFEGGFSCVTAEQAARAVEKFQKPQQTPKPRDRWLIPRHLSLQMDLDRFQSLHQELLDSSNLWGLEDAGTREINAYLVHRIHCAFVNEILNWKGTGKVVPEFLHASKACEFIRLHSHHPISLDDVAKHLSINPSYLSRCFQKQTRLTVVEFIQRTRVEAAKKMLREGDFSMKEVAFQCGFKSSSYFGRLFRRYNGRTATEFLSGK